MYACSIGEFLHESTHFHYFIQPPPYVATHIQRKEFCEGFYYLLERSQVEEREVFGWRTWNPRNTFLMASFKLQANQQEIGLLLLLLLLLQASFKILKLETLAMASWFCLEKKEMKEMREVLEWMKEWEKERFMLFLIVSFEGGLEIHLETKPIKN